MEHKFPMERSKRESKLPFNKQEIIHLLFCIYFSGYNFHCNGKQLQIFILLTMGYPTSMNLKELTAHLPLP